MPTTPEPGENETNFKRIDRDICLNEAWHEADEMARKTVAEEGLSDEEAEPAIETWRSLYAYDTAPLTTQRLILEAEGISLPAADELNDAALTAKLWQIISALAARNTFLHNTDHLNDRELYTHLVEETFNEMTQDLVAPGWNHHIDILGCCSDEDIEKSLRYYSDDEERARWLKQFPDYVLPPKEKPPYDRDRHLPKATSG